MVHYLSCIKKKKGHNDPECRDLAKNYLSCRMDRYLDFFPRLDHRLLTAIFICRNLMAKDEFKNLGFSEAKPSDVKNSAAGEGKKGELRW
jgi:cytochrome c oxidase assembly protein subunit 19